MKSDKNAFTALYGPGTRLHVCTNVYSEEFGRRLRRLLAVCRINDHVRASAGRENWLWYGRHRKRHQL